MSVTELMRYKYGRGKRFLLSLMLAQHCAPLIMYDKISNIITIQKEDFSGIKEILRGTDIRYHILKSSGSKLILFLYRSSDFEDYLSRDDIREFLFECGYDKDSDALGFLYKLAKRIFFYQNGEKVSFPHEIGVFLGYPLCDVIGFMENGGNNWLLSSYWKVYDNAEDTAALFDRFERDRDYLIREVARGAEIRDFITEKPMLKAAI